jgi:lysophospholipase L1-like esterase
MSNTIVCMGDSLTAGSNGEGTLTKTLNIRIAEKYPGLSVVNLGVPGESAVGLNIRRANANLYSPFRVIVWSGVNDVAADQSAVTVQNTLQGIYTYYKVSLGYEVWAFTITPVDTDSGARNTVRNTVNTWIKDTATSVDRVIDAWTALRDPSDPGKRLPAYADQTDIVHLNDAAYAALLNLFP